MENQFRALQSAYGKIRIIPDNNSVLGNKNLEDEKTKTENLNFFGL